MKHLSTASRADRPAAWPERGSPAVLGLCLTLAVHGGMAWLVLAPPLRSRDRQPVPPTRQASVLTILVAPPTVLRAIATPRPARTSPHLQLPHWEPQRVLPTAPGAPLSVLATQAAPPPPTAEEWALAGRYTLKNSKAYRHSWGQQVRSLMGTAVEGPDQGMVRFRVEIAPDGSLARLETLWSTSPVAERLARQAIAAMPPGPATPTGQPLVFERTISFSPFAQDDRPLYRDDCKPDPPIFSNPFAWNGTAEPAQQVYAGTPKADPDALADCLKQLPRDSIDAEIARGQRMMEQWGWSASTPGK